MHILRPSGFCVCRCPLGTSAVFGVMFILLEDRDITLPNSELLFIVVAVMGSIHIAFSTYLNHRGRRSST